MKFNKIIVLAACMAAATGASAQTSNFEGFSGGLNLNAVAATTQIELFDTTLDGIGQQSYNASLQGAYGFVTGPSSIISIGASYGLGKSKAGEISDGTDSINISAKNQLSIYVEPGFLVGNSTLVYGKLSYEKAKIEGSSSDGDSASTSINGTGIGAGSRTMLNKTTYLQVEFKRVSYRSTTFGDGDTSFKASATLGTIGIGMKF